MKLTFLKRVVKGYLRSVAPAVSITFLSLMVCTQGFGQSKPTAADSSAQQRTEAYQHLNRQIYARREDPGSGSLNSYDRNMLSISKQLDSMIAREVETALAAPKPSAESIVASISALQGSMSLSEWGLDATNMPFARLFSLNGIQTAAIAYVIMQGGGATPDTQTHLSFYDTASGNWAKKATAPTLRDFEGYTFSVAQLNSGVPGEVWFLAWGAPFGSSHASMRIRLYSFDGSTVRTIWKRDNLDGGKVTAAPDTVTIDFLDTKDPSIERHELFHVSPDGLLPQ
jgi:hypothetical protein